MPEEPEPEPEPESEESEVELDMEGVIGTRDLHSQEAVPLVAQSE